MKRKKFLILAFTLLCLLLTSCSEGGKISENLKIIESEPSLIYTEEEIADAISVTKSYFKREFSGCTLESIGYAGDEKSIAHKDFAERDGSDEAIVLISSFHVDSSGGDGSLNPDSTYRNWMWILARKNNGNWVHVDHGY